MGIPRLARDCVKTQSGVVVRVLARLDSRDFNTTLDDKYRMITGCPICHEEECRRGEALALEGEGRKEVSK